MSLIKKLNPYDLHVHGAPDGNIPRKWPDLDIAISAKKNGIRGILFKAHNEQTTERAKKTNSKLGEEFAYSSFVMNRCNGGINKKAVEKAILNGAKIIYFPTLDAERYNIVKKGKLLFEAIKILELAKKKDIFVATGHIGSKKDNFLSLKLLIKEASKLKAKVIVTHPEFLGLDKKIQKGILGKNIFFERTYYTIRRNNPKDKLDINQDKLNEIAGNISDMGCNSTILSSDLGQPQNLRPDKGLEHYFQLLRKKGMSLRELYVMSNKNPRKVLGLLDKNAEWIENFAADFVFSHQKKQKTKYRLPIIGFGDVAKIDKKIESLKRNDALPKEHGLLSELLPNAKTVISIFLPFSKNIINNNLSSEHASEEWHLAYSEANKMLAMLIENISKMLKSKGFSSAKIYASHHLSNQLQKRYDICELFSKYSLRHLAEASGIGKFGFNGLLITEYGCNGRIAAIVTDMKIENTPYFNEEYCLAKKGALCYACANACPVNAFDGGRFNRLVCMNERLVKERDYARKHYKVIPRQVCGLCGTGTDFIKVRCAFGIPRKEDEKA